MALSDPSRQPPLPADAIVLTRARPEPLLFAAVVDLVARHAPFSTYPFGVLVARLKRQLQQRSAVVALQQNRAIGYFGGVQVNDQDARQWLQSRGANMPEPNWDSGNAMVITVVVADQPRLLRPMARSFAGFYPEHRGYWKRVYGDGRPDSWRVPFRSRRP